MAIVSHIDAPEEFYRGPSWWRFSIVERAGRTPGIRRVVLLWTVASVVTIAASLLEAAWGWSGIPISLGSRTIGFTVYPPLLLTLLLTIWLGPTWGVVPAYLATLASALYSGMPLGMSALFALATPVELLIVWGSMVTLNVSPDLQRWKDWRRYLVIGMIAAVASSLAALIWNYGQQLDPEAGQRIWQGWIVGDFVQIVVIGGPLLRWLGSPMRGWIDKQIGIPPEHAVSYTRGVALVIAIVGILVAVVFQGVVLIVDTLNISPDALTSTGDPLAERLRELGLFVGLLFAIAMLTTVLFSSALARIGERDRSVALRDTLTGCFNRRAFRGLFDKEADRSDRLGEGLSLVFFDVDLFKQVNDKHGHDVGDEVLRQLARRVRSVIREHDLLFRWGGEEFVLLLPHTNPDLAPTLAERIRAAVAGRPLVTVDVPEPITVTLSLGTTGTLEFPTDPDTLIVQADAASYAAKHRGRNRVVRHGSLEQGVPTSPLV